MKEADVQVLQEMCPNVSEDAIRHLRVEQGFNNNTVIDILVSQIEKSKPSSLSSLLTENAITSDDDRAIHDPSILKKNLIIEFAGEEGIDAGALRCEFFEQLMKSINTVI